MEDIIRIIAENGILITIAGMALYFAARFILIYLERIKVQQVVNIEDHPLFSYLRQNIEVKIDTLTIAGTCRNRVFRQFLKIKFSTFYKNLRLISNQKTSKMSAIELNSFLHENLTESIVEYEKECEKVGIPKFVIHAFNKWHKDHVNVVSDRIYCVCNNDYFINNAIKLAVIFEVYKLGFELTILDATRTLKDLNGDLTSWCKENQKLLESWIK